MWIQELNIKNFGKFTNKKIELTSGINVIYGENESGKSTLHGFIRGCLFGIRKMRGRASKTDVYNRYLPWDNPAYYAGAMRFVCGRKVFRLERDFTKGVQSGVLVCESDGERLSLENGDLQMLLGNIGEVTFDNTVSIGQLKNETDEGLAVELKNYMANLEGTGNTSIRVEKALTLLKEKKRQLEKKILGIKQADEQKNQQIYAHIHFLTEEKNKEQLELEKVKYQLEQLEKAVKETVLKEEIAQSLWQRFCSWLKRFFLRLIGKTPDTKETSSEREEKKIELRSRLIGKREHLKNQIQEKNIQIENGREELEQQKELHYEGQIKTLQEEIQACDLAMERIQQVVSHMQTDIGQFLKKRTSEIFSEITQGKYQWVEVQEDLTLGVHGQDHFIPVEQLSRGTIWQLYFALRMAANEILGQEEEMPVILDDAFVMYDDTRLGQILHWLEKQNKQVIIFTCQKREQEWLRQQGILFHQVRL